MLQYKRKIHFIGISGIGMSGIAKILQQQGHSVSGCDNNIDSKHVLELKKLGCKISPTHLSSICCDKDIDIIVYSSAIKKDHLELIKARKDKKKTLLRAEILAEIMKDKHGIAISGSHGKTSTTGLIGQILISANLSPSIVIGGHSSSIKSNAVLGSGQYFIAEADESDRSLLKLPKKYTILTNIDLEHLETYKDLADIEQTFIQFINAIPNDGKNILCIDDPGIKKIINLIKTPYSTYGQSNEAEIQARNIQLNAESSSFDIFQKSTNKIIEKVNLSQPGIHSVINATGAIALAIHLKIDFCKIKTALLSYNGVDRRFSFCGITKKHGAEIFNDYGHHPTEIKHAITIAKKRAKNRLIVIFQPHRFSRTQHLWNDFISTLSSALINKLIITDIYPANEKPIKSINSKQLINDINKASASYCRLDQEFKSIEAALDKELKKGDLLLLLGAGKVYQLAKKLI